MALERLINASVELQNRYPRFRDDPSSDDLKAWDELREATLEADLSMTHKKRPDALEQ